MMFLRVIVVVVLGRGIWRCDETRNPPNLLDNTQDISAGTMTGRVGVSSEPREYYGGGGGSKGIDGYC